MKTTVELQTSQQINLTPKMLQALRLLQLSQHELHQEVQQILDKNPLLTSDENSEVTANIPLSTGVLRQQSDNNYEPTAGLTAPQPEDNLHSYLRWQVQTSHLDEQAQMIAEYLLAHIDDNGYLDRSLAEISANSPYSEQDFKPILAQLQQFDPPGIAARDLTECLTIQLQAIKNKHKYLAINIVQQHLADIVEPNYQQLAQTYQCQIEDIQQAIDLITRLHPKPGYRLTQAPTEYIQADLQVSRVKTGRLDVKLLTMPWQSLRLDPTYLKVLQQPAYRHHHLQEQLQEAKWLLNSIALRQQHLLAIGRYLVKHQAAFFQQGDIAMQALSRQQLANDLQLHPSTISRLCRHKYVQCPSGTFALSHFFTNGLNAECSATAVRARIKQLIQHEACHQPLSDAAIVQRLTASGIPISRRTVTKYRRILKIPSSYQRKFYHKHKAKKETNDAN